MYTSVWGWRKENISCYLPIAKKNIDTKKNFLSLFTAINKMAEKYGMPILYSCHPRSRNRLAASGFRLDPRVIQHEPLGFHDYNCLQMNAFCVVSDSGTLPEESSFFTSVGHPFPYYLHSNFNWNVLRRLTKETSSLQVLTKRVFYRQLIQQSNFAEMGNMESQCQTMWMKTYLQKVVKIIQSYIGIVNTRWFGGNFNNLFIS